MTKGLVERRCVEFELRAEASAASGKLVGRAVVYDSETVIGGMFREVFRAGAFTKTLRESKNIVALWNHNDMYVLGSTRGGTLELRDGKEGLEFEIDPPSKSPYDGFRENIQRGDVSQMSFRFVAVKEEVDDPDGEGDKLPLRAVTEARLIEISPVTFPAYEDTEVEARAREVVETWKAEGKGVSLRDQDEPPSAGNTGGTPVPRSSGDGTGRDDSEEPGGMGPSGVDREDGDGDSRTTPEPGASAAHSVEPGGMVPEYVLNYQELDAEEAEL